MDIINELVDCGIIYNSINRYKTVRYDLALCDHLYTVSFNARMYLNADLLRTDIEKIINHIDVLTDLLCLTDIKSEHFRQTIFTKEEFVIIITFNGDELLLSLNSYKYNSKKFNDLNEFIEFLRKYHLVLFKPIDIKIAIKD